MNVNIEIKLNDKIIKLELNEARKLYHKLDSYFKFRSEEFQIFKPEYGIKEIESINV
jgi:hypothetical protein